MLPPDYLVINPLKEITRILVLRGRWVMLVVQLQGHTATLASGQVVPCHGR
ncbi:hypothetical protein [Candidatus Aalborgicola defluviihabitans]|uniref:hypothetical protein n=1 Tax=Candidatus Aalborgicola defluviihabitans TaxID=3386187 RepID=UPI001DB400F7|nr:hypothetical protein [Burkholderiales bacterium]